MSHQKVTLGDHEYDAYPQRIGYLENKLGRYFSTIMDMEAESGNMLTLLREKGYELMRVFYPKLMPEWQFRGFASEGAMKEGSYDEDHDHGPDFPQVKHAFSVAMEVNGLNLFGDLVKRLGGYVDREMIEKVVNLQIAQVVEGTAVEVPNSDGSTTESSVTTEASPSMSSSQSSPISAVPDVEGDAPLKVVPLTSE